MANPVLPASPAAQSIRRVRNATRASGHENVAPLTQHHATTTGQSQPAVTSCQSRRGLAELAVRTGRRRSAVTDTIPQPVHAPSRDSLHAKGEARLARMPLRSRCPARHRRRHGRPRPPAQIGGDAPLSQIQGRSPTVTSATSWCDHHRRLRPLAHGGCTAKDGAPSTRFCAPRWLLTGGQVRRRITSWIRLSRTR
jgi:hypothetical protein